MGANKNSKLEKIFSKLTDDERAYVCGLIKRDPLAGLYKKSLIAYTLLLTILLLQPFDFAYRLYKNNVKWVEQSNGLEFFSKGQVISISSTEELCNRLISGSGFTLEAWVSTQDETQTGPARIVSYSLDPFRRNFTLGQHQKALVMRLRTTETDTNGIYPHLKVEDVFGSPLPQHIVVTYDFLNQSVYVNGDRRIQKASPEGRFTNWNPSYYLVLGNEATGNRPWVGKIFFVAIYDRVLEEREIHRNYHAGWLSESYAGETSQRVSEGLVTRYIFDEKRGDNISDSSGTNSPLNLHIPSVIRNRINSDQLYTFESFLNYSRITTSKLYRDLLLNLIIFMPVGFLLHAALRIRYGSSLKTLAFVILVGTALTFCVESLQYFSSSRSSSAFDILCNILGTVSGIATDKIYSRYLESRVAPIICSSYQKHNS